MLGKNNQFMNQKKVGRKFEKYSIKKLKVGAASVLVGAGFFLGFHVEASEINEPATNEVVSSSTKENKEKVVTLEEKSIKTTPFAKNKLVEEKNSNLTVEKASSTKIVEKTEQPSVERKATVETSQLADKMIALQGQVTRIRSNEKQKSFIEKAEKLLEEAKALQTLSTVTQEAVDAKTKEISALTSILKSIKAEETPKENKNQDSRNGKKMEEGTGFRTGVTEQALTGSIHFDNSNGPIEKQIPVENNGDGERVINMAITYSASSSETVTDGKVRVTIPKAFLHSTKKPEFKNSSFVKSVDDLSTTTNYVYDLNLNPMSGGTVAESLLKLYVGTSIKNAPSRGDVLSVNTDFIAGGETLSTKSARASFDYLSEILYREKEWRTKTVKYMVDQFGAPLPEFKMGSVSNGTFKPIEGNTFKLPFIMSDQSFFNNEETNQNGNGRLTSYDYTISGIPDFLELDPTNIKNNKFWTLENGVLTLHPDENKGIDQSLLYGGPILKVKEGAFNTPEAIERVIESNSTKGFNANIVYKAVGHRPDGSTFTQTLDNPDGFRLYLGDGIPAIKEMDTRIFPETNQRLYSHASNEDKFNARFSIPNDKLKGDGAFLPSQYINYFIPKDQEGNYFTKFQLNRVFTNEIKADGSREFRGYYREKLEGNLKENFKLYGVTKDNQAELLKEYTSIDELYNTIEINPEKKYEHLILKHPGIVDEFQRYNSTSKTITGLEARLGVTVGTWKEKAQDSTIQRYRNEIAQGSTSENTIESAIAMERPATGSGEVAEHIKTPTKLTLNMNQIGSQTLTKDDLTRGQTIPIAVTYSAEDYFGLIESDNDGSKTYDINKLDPNITKTSVMLLADPNLPLKDFRLAADNRLLSKYTLHFGGANGDAAKESYDKLKESYDTVNPTNIIENYKGTGKRAYIFDSKDLNLTGYDLNRWIKGGLYSPTALTFEVENNGQVEAGTYGIESYLVWNSESETLIGNDNSINANFVENHAPGLSISKANINVTINNVAEYSSSLTIAKPGTTGVRGIIDVKNGQEVILSPQIENLTDLPQKVKEAVVLIPKTEALTYLEGPIVDDSDEYDVVYTTSTATDKTTGTYVTADQITNWKDVTAVKYVFKNNYTITKEHAFKHHFNLRVDQNNPNYVRSTSQIFLKDGKDTWLESNVVGLRTEDVRGKLEVYYKTVDGELLKEFPKTRDFEGQPYATTKEPILKGFVNRWYAVNDYIFIEVQPDSAPETGTYERQVTKKVTYLYDKAKVKVETKDITRTINYIEKNNEGNIISNPVIQKVTVSRKVYTGEKTGRVVEDNWEIPANAKWESVTSPTPSEWEKPEVKVNDQYIAKAVIDEVSITPEILNNGNVVENVYYERFVPVGGDVVAKYVIEGTTTELKAETDVAKGLKVGKNYTSTAPVAGEELTATDGKVYVYKGHKTTSAAETGTVTADKQEVVYEYAPKLGGNVEVKYVVAGTEENLKDPVALVTNGQIGSDYTAKKDATITKEDGRVYKLVAANNGLKTGSAGETGKVTEAKQEVVYEYAPKVGGNVEVKYVIAGTETNLKDPVALVTDGQVGSDYTATKENTITKDGLVYELVKTNNGLKAGSATETGKVTEAKQEVVYEFELQKGDVIVSYIDTEGNEIEGKTSVKAETQSPTGKEYNTNTPDLKPEMITTTNGDVYEFVKKSETSAPEIGKVNKGVTTVEYIYRKVITSYVNEEGKEINPSDKGTKDKKDIPEYIFKETKKDEKGNTTHVYRKVITSYVDEEGKEINPSDKGTKDKKDIPEYIYKETKKDDKGNTIHVYRQVITSYVDETGKEINPSDKGTKDKKDIPEYIFKETKKDEKGNTIHVYRQVVTSYVDEEGKEINPSDKGTKDKKDIPEYIYKETKKDEKGNTIHVYRQVVTSYVNEEGKEINPSDKGTKDKKDIPEYIYKETKKDEKGNTIHVYRKKQSSTPEKPKLTPETPNTDQSKSTIWKSVDGETLKPRENGTKDKSSIPGYEFVRTEKDKEGNTVHIYRKVTSSTPEVKEKVTSYVDENGKELRSPKKGTHPKETIPGYEFVRTETESNGNVRHVYRQVAHSEVKVDKPTTVEERKNELPNTGTGNEFTIFGAAAASILAGLGIAIPGKKKEE